MPTGNVGHTCRAVYSIVEISSAVLPSRRARGRLRRARSRRRNCRPLGSLAATHPDAYAVLLRAFRVGLKATGFIEGQNVATEYRWAEGRNDKLPEFAVDLVRRQVAVIVAPTTPSVLAAKAATKTIPIVFFTAGDPVDLGLVASLSRPDSNLTGATTLTLEVGPKWLQFLHEMVPHATSLALLINPTSPNLAEAQSRARGSGPHPRAAASCAESQHRQRLRDRLRKGGPIGREWTRD